MGVGAIATEDLKPEELYLEVPREYLISDEHILQTPLGPIVEEIEKTMGPDSFHRLLFYLLSQRNNQSNFWKPYFDILPQNFMHLPIMYDDNVLKELRHTVFWGELQDQNNTINERFQFLQEKIFSQYDEFDADVFSYENYRWATLILDSRTIWISGKRYLVPVLDSINCCGATDLARPHKTIFDDEGLTETRASSLYLEDEQVFENYAQPNHEYFLYHGFFLDENHHDCLLARIRAINEEDPEKTEKRKYLQKHYGIRLDSKDRIHACITPQKHMSENMLHAMIVRTTTMKNLHSNDLPDHITTYTALFHDLDSLDKKYDYPLHIDRNMLIDSLDPLMYKVLKYRIKERELLHRIMDEYLKHIHLHESKHREVVHDDLQFTHCCCFMFYSLER
eukprot:TRINITY_DN1457_c0_g1_i9.p1 TRINITY_DN1457_c0_g1~~TRINITY_DN1457_c0_g1_i9.p1  ORF type:complete len:394 (+),score=67.47 TRINITY_DN1457_c0_g1_i9:290-1471(+)